MATPTNIIVPAPYVVIERSASINVVSADMKSLVGAVRVIGIGVTVVEVGDVALFSIEGATQFTQSSTTYFIVNENAVRIIDTYVAL